jgi:prepilin-type N-terminal cleavage/methylation domain-containing protein
LNACISIWSVTNDRQPFIFLKSHRDIRSSYYVLKGFLDMPFVSRQAFTLTELLVSLAVLGLIAAFAIPKVLSAVADSATRAGQKHTIETLQKLVSSGVANSDFVAMTVRTTSADTDPIVTYLTQNLNAQHCVVGNVDPPCNHMWNTTTATTPSATNAARWVLPSGVKIWIPNAGFTANSLDFNIDANPNGLSEATRAGADLLAVRCNVGKMAFDHLGVPLQPGQCRPLSTGNQTTWDALYN